MNPAQVGSALKQARSNAGLTQAELARRMGTSQSAIARAESGLVEPTISFLERFIVETQEALWIGQILLAPTTKRVDIQARLERAVGPYRPNPWNRDPTPAEQRSLESDGLTREFFDGSSDRSGR